MYYFTSDTHFGYDNIINREKRPFKNWKVFEKSIIKIWNKQTKKDDIIYAIGDFFNCNKNDYDSWKHTLTIAKKLKAKIIIIIGNNEERIINKQFNGDFEKFKECLISHGYYDVKKEEYLKINSNLFYLNHYPVNRKINYINLFGHVHRATGLWKPFGLNMDCDLNYFHLYSEKDIEQLLKEKSIFWDTDPNVFIM